MKLCTKIGLRDLGFQVWGSMDDNRKPSGDGDRGMAGAGSMLGDGCELWAAMMPSIGLRRTPGGWDQWQE